MKKIIRLYYLIPVLLFYACSTEDKLTNNWVEENGNKVIIPTAGTLDLSNYVAVGNSITAGFSDGALYPEGQHNSFPNILATQFQLVGGGPFRQPDISSGNGYGGLRANSTVRGKSFINLEAALAALNGEPGTSVGDAIQFTDGSLLTPSSFKGASLNNFGVPGARVIDLATSGYGAPNIGNTFYQHYVSSPTSSILEDVKAADPSFFTLWIGGNDVLGYALTGGSHGETFNPLNPNTITPIDLFTSSLQETLDELSKNGTEGVILNIPPIATLPFFQIVTQLGDGINLIPLDAVTLASQGVTVDFVLSLLNGSYSAYNTGLDALVPSSLTQEEADYRKIVFREGNNPPIIIDNSLTDLTSINPALLSMRQAKIDPITGLSDLFPITALFVIGTEAVPGNIFTVYGTGAPIPDENILTIEEQKNVIEAYVAYNIVIEAEANKRENITLVDVGPIFADLFGLSVAQAVGLGLSTAAQERADGELGMDVNGITLVPLSLSEEQLYNSIWSTDGIHPNPRGAAILANEIIDALNSTYGATIPRVNPLEYEPINAPF